MSQGFFFIVFFVSFSLVAQEEILPGKWVLQFEQRGDCGDTLLIKKIKALSADQPGGKKIVLSPKGKFSCEDFLGKEFTSGKWKVAEVKKLRQIDFYGKSKSAAKSLYSLKIIFMDKNTLILMGGTEGCKYFLLKKQNE
jgi:hypothetical protein